jgi:uncharacterized protein YPO0396
LFSGRSSCSAISAFHRRRLPARHDLGHVARHAHGLHRVDQRAADALLDPPRRVRREAAAGLRVELLDRAHQADVALLDQVHELQPAVHVVLRDRHDEPEVGADHVLARREVAALHALGELDLLLGRQQRHFVDVGQVGVQPLVSHRSLRVW